MRTYLFNDQKIKIHEQVMIEKDLFNHIFKVCRHKLADKFELMQSDKAFLVEVIELEKKKAVVKILSKRELPKLKKPYIHLILANPKPNVLENVIEKCVELGVKSIQVVSSENSFLKNEKKINTKRLTKIMNQAQQQSGNSQELEIREPGKLEQVIANIEGEAFLFYEKPLKGAGALQYRPGISSVSLVVGGEGGFSESEVECAKKSGVQIINLGERIMKVETACITSISILKSTFSLW